MGVAPMVAGAIELEVDPAHSNIGFEIKHLMVSSVHGSFTEYSGNLDVNEKDFTKSKIDFKVKASSINTANSKRDEHLKSADFFDVQKYPEATFVGKSIKSIGRDKYTLEGDLTIHGQTKPAKFTLLNLGKVKDPYGVEKFLLQASTELVRKDFGLTYNAALEKGGVVIGEKVKLTVDLEASAKVAAK